ncbi:MAG: outer membrane protein assembly factor BamA [Endomicrobiales bacterium]
MRRSIIPLILAAVFSAQAFAQNADDKVSAVLIEGEKNVKEKTIRGQIKSRAGKPYSDETVKSDIQNILELGSFENVEVSVDTDTWRVTFMVKEKPYVKKINFKGNKVFSQGRLKDEVTLKEKEFYDLAKLEESKAKVLSLYNEKGYADAKLEVYPTIEEATSQITVTFIINEGNRILIGDVDIQGLKAYPEKKILKLMKTRRKKVFKDETLRGDVQEIEKFYKNNGYTEAKVGEPQITYNPERTLMSIVIPVTEGPKYRIGAVAFSGQNVISEQALRKALTMKSGELYNEERLQETMQALRELYSDRGYLHSRVEPEFTPQPERGLMDITFTIAEGDLIYLGNAYVDGLTYTKEYVIRREITLKEGDVFSAGKVRRSLEKIYNLGFIDAVEPEIQPTEKRDIMDLVLNVTEGKPGVLTAGAGYSSVDQLVGTLQVQHMNLFGRGQRLNLMWEFGARKQNYEIDWTEPWFLSKPMSLGLSAFNTERTFDYGNVLGAYVEGRQGGTVRIGPRLNDYLSLLFSYSYEDIRVSDIDVSISTSAIRPSHDITSSISSQVIWDTRDNVFDPSRGNRQSLSVQLAGGPLGGSINFVKPIVRSSWYFPTFWKFVLSLNGTVGLVENFNPSADVPIYERFYVGGAETVRGYQYRTEIGPLEGGKLMSVFNAEYKFPIVQERKRSILQGAFFFDLGGSWRSANDINFSLGEGENNFRAGVGFGIRFTTPVFPLRLDWGYGLNHKPGEELSQFYFTIGNIF